MTRPVLHDVRRRMSEAMLLPPDHPLRQAVVEHVAAADGPLEREWLELVQEDERMRVELARVKPPPPSLHQRRQAAAMAFGDEEVESIKRQLVQSLFEWGRA